MTGKETETKSAKEVCDVAVCLAVCEWLVTILKPYDICNGEELSLI